MFIHFTPEKGAQTRTLQTVIKNDKPWIVYTDHEKSVYLFESEPELTSEKLKFKLIQLLFHEHSLSKNWNSDLCLLLRKSLGCFGGNFESASRDQITKTVINSFNEQWKQQETNTLDFDNYPPLYVALYYGEHYAAYSTKTDQ